MTDASPAPDEATPGRIPRFTPERLTGAAADLYSRYTSGERARPGTDFSLVDADGQLTGPPAAWMLAPELGLGLERLGFEVRYGLSLSPRVREIVILLVAAAEDNDFERYAHHRAGRRAGLDDREIEGLDSGSFRPADEYESAVVRVASAVLELGTLDAPTWSEAERVLGARAIFEIVTLVGWYRMMAVHLRVFGIEPPR